MDRPRHVAVTGPLAPFAASFEENLAGQGYKCRAVSDHLYLMAQLSCWLVTERLAAENLSASGVESFRCWRQAAGYVSSSSTTRMSRLVDYLVGIGVVPGFEPAVASTQVELLMERYRRYLAEERGLSTSSIRSYTGVARDFLARLATEDELDLEALTSAEVSEFVLAECRRCKVASARRPRPDCGRCSASCTWWA